MKALREMVWIIALPCTQATRIISDSLDGRPPWHLRLALRVHVLLCRACRRYRQQLESLRRAFRALEAEAGDAGAAGMLSAEARARIHRTLEEH